jgi:hypothetical protein
MGVKMWTDMKKGAEPRVGRDNCHPKAPRSGAEEGEKRLKMEGDVWMRCGAADIYRAAAELQPVSGRWYRTRPAAVRGGPKPTGRRPPHGEAGGVDFLKIFSMGRRAYLKHLSCSNKIFLA